MSEEKLNATIEKITGGAKELFGKVTGDKELEVEGTVDKLIGKAKEVVADAEDAVKGAVDSVKRHLDEADKPSE